MSEIISSGGVVDKYIWDSDGNIICLGQFSIHDTSIVPIAPPEMPGSSGDIYLRYLKDNISPKTYPITTKSCIMGGISRGSTREVIDLSNFISADYTGNINLINIADHIKYYTINIKKVSGRFTDGENVLTRNLPIQYRPIYPLVLKGFISKDNGPVDMINKYTIYIAINGVLRLITNPRYDISLNNGTINKTSLMDANTLTAFAVYIE